jgi:hypothetical protein
MSGRRTKEASSSEGWNGASGESDGVRAGGLGESTAGSVRGGEISEAVSQREKPSSTGQTHVSPVPWQQAITSPAAGVSGATSARTRSAVKPWRSTAGF